MVPGAESVLLSRIQFGMTAMYHFIFVPLTLGLSLLMGIMETIYVMTGRSVWRKMTQFWGVLFGINFAMGVATGITMEFQFGTNWSYYSRYVGDIFGAPLAIEGLMAFFLEATFIGLFFFGWNRLSKGGHLFVTWMVALGSNLSALWILIANGWMQHPVGSHFNFETMRMEISNFYQVIFNPVAQAKFVHTVSAGYVTGAMFVLGVCAYYFLRNRNIDFAKRSMCVAAAFGLASTLSVIVLGDESGYVTTHHQKMKLAAIEGMWHTEPAPASFTLAGWPDKSSHKTHFAVKVPYALGLIATRSWDTQLPGMEDLATQAQGKIMKGLTAYSALQTLKDNPKDQAAQKQLKAQQDNLGYALLLKQYVDNPLNATRAQIEKASQDTIPNQTAALFWTFRLMVGSGLLLVALFTTTLVMTMKGTLWNKRWMMWAILACLPLPWLASESGWFVAENGRQPWVIEHILPTFMGASNLSTAQVWISVVGFVLFYTVLAIVAVYLMIKSIRTGPEGMGFIQQKTNKE